MSEAEIVTAATAAKVGGGGGLTALAWTVFDWFRKRGSAKAIRREISELRDSASKQDVTLARLEERMVTKDDMAKLVDRINANGQEMARNFGAALGAGLKDAHGRIDEILLHKES